MSFRSAVHEWVRDTLDVSVHDGALPVRPMLPAIVQRFVSATTLMTHAGPASLFERRVQFDVYAGNDKQVDELSMGLIAGLDGFRGDMGDVHVGAVELLSEVDSIPAEVKGGGAQYRRILDFGFTYTEPREVALGS